MKNQKSSIDSIRKWNKIMEKVWFYIAVIATATSLVIGFVDNWQGVIHRNNYRQTAPTAIDRSLHC